MSVYLNQLSDEVKERYVFKMSLINNVDPYDCAESSFVRSVSDFPAVTFCDIQQYFVCTKSAYTLEAFRAFKSLDAYKFYECDWVRDILIRQIGDNILVLGKVMHSQRLNEKPAQPWFIAKAIGEILCGHCNCIAGLGEACSHLGALMYAVEDAKSHEKSVSVTGVKAYWKVPQGQVAEMSSWNEELVRKKKVKSSPARNIPETTREEMISFLHQVRDQLDITSPVMTILPPFCEEICAQKEKERSGSLLDLYKKENESLTLSVLRDKAEEFFLILVVTPEDCKRVEETTRGQSDKQSWFMHRTGRVTASKFKNACCTTTDKPAISTIRSICYPLKTKFTSKQTMYGCAHEKDALESYHELANIDHNNFRLCTTGLILSPSYPHFGASPDAIISCDCCGHGCVEVKCPYCVKDTSLAECLPKYITKGTNYLQLKTNHSYYYQVQMQMALCHKEFCDFVVWSDKDLYVERIYFDSDFWQAESDKATNFWKLVIVPELLGRYYTTEHALLQMPDPQPSTSAAVTAPTPRTWCICQKPDDGNRMIKCDNRSCPTEWFHMECLHMKRSRKKWLCDTCKK